MVFSGHFWAVCMIALMGVFSSLAEAADVSVLQTALSLARDEMDAAQRKHDASAQAVAQQQKIVARRKAQLAEENRRLEALQKDAKQGDAQYLEAKQKYDKAQANLDAAWRK